jgi:hypothetical protein
MPVKAPRSPPSASWPQGCPAGRHGQEAQPRAPGMWRAARPWTAALRGPAPTQPQRPPTAPLPGPAAADTGPRISAVESRCSARKPEPHSASVQAGWLAGAVLRTPLRPLSRPLSRPSAFPAGEPASPLPPAAAPTARGGQALLRSSLPREPWQPALGQRPAPARSRGVRPNPTATAPLPSAGCPSRRIGATTRSSPASRAASAERARACSRRARRSGREPRGRTTAPAAWSSEHPSRIPPTASRPAGQAGRSSSPASTIRGSVNAVGEELMARG